MPGHQKLLEVRHRPILTVGGSTFHGSACHKGPAANIQMPTGHFYSFKPLLSVTATPTCNLDHNLLGVQNGLCGQSS